MRFFVRLLVVLGTNGVILWGLGLEEWSGHSRAQLGVKVSTGGSGHEERAASSLLAEFLTASILFTLAHGFFLGILLYGLFRSAPDMDACWIGAAGIGLFHLAGFVVDLFGLKERPFAWIKFIAQAGLGRVVLVHLAIIGGVAVVAATRSNAAFFLAFAGLKLLVEVGNLFGRERRIQRAPDWLVWLLNRLQPGTDFAA